MRNVVGNRSTQRKSAPVRFCPPQIPYNLTWDRTQAAAVGIRRLTACHARSRAFVNTIMHLGSEVLIAVVMKSYIFWDITPCRPLKVNWRFGGTCRLHLQGRRISRARNQSESSWQADMGATCSSETSVEFQRTARRYIPEDRTLHYNERSGPKMAWNFLNSWTTNKKELILYWVTSNFQVVVYRKFPLYEFYVPPSCTSVRVRLCVQADRFHFPVRS
jgi:hypothetical protein